MVKVEAKSLENPWKARIYLLYIFEYVSSSRVCFKQVYQSCTYKSEILKSLRDAESIVCA